MTATLVVVTMSDHTIEPQAGRGPTRGWCPGVLDPMETGDGWLLRIRVPGGFIAHESLAAVAEISEEFGSGIVDITSRANLQIRGVPAERLDRAACAVVDAGLADGDARIDAFRAVVSSPLTGHDPHAVRDARPVVDALVTRLASDIVGDAPSKFGVVIDDGGSWPLDDVNADIALQACPDDTWAVRVRSRPDHAGRTAHPLEVIATTTQVCVDEGSRMDRVVALIGLSDLRRRLGLSAPDHRADSRPRTAGSERLIGVLPHIDEQQANVVAAPFLARVDAATLTTVSQLASGHDAALRLTPDHSIAFCGIRADAAAIVCAELNALGLVVDNDDPRAQISGCVGSLGCSWAHADTWAAGHELAKSAYPTRRVHLSACAKQCGAPALVRQLVADPAGVFR
ncbi:MAG: precorrin-3B synthase [Ilumatobacteraceae bacterium]